MRNQPEPPSPKPPPTDRPAQIGTTTTSTTKNHPSPHRPNGPATHPAGPFHVPHIRTINDGDIRKLSDGGHPIADGVVDGPPGRRREGDEHDPGAVAEDAQDSVAVFFA
jgi:hypothetical protein